MYKTRNTGTGNGMRGTRGIGGMLYSEECRQTFWGMSPNILGNVFKQCGECPQTFRGISPNILGNVLKHSGKCPQTFRGISSNIPGNVLKHSGKCPQTFRGISSNIPGNVLKHSGECRKTFLDSTISWDNSSLSLDSYNLTLADHPKNIKQGGFCIYYRETLPVKTVQINSCLSA